jgi:hypothetical protein
LLTSISDDHDAESPKSREFAVRLLTALTNLLLAARDLARYLWR